MPSFEPARDVLRCEAKFLPAPLPAPSGAGGRAAPLASAAAEAPPQQTPAPTDAEAIRQAAYEEGRAAGRAERPDGEVAALRSALRVLEDAAAGLGALRRSCLHAHRHAVVELALGVAEPLLGRALAAGDVRVRAGMTEVDARLAELLQRFREELSEAIAVEQAELDETAARVAGRVR